MRLTKFEHACLAIEVDNSTIVVDPGNFSHDFIMPRRVVAVVITHEHPDHLDNQLLGQILESNPKAVIFGHESITARFADWPTQAAVVGEPYQVGPFKLQFFGGTHQPIDESMSVPPNLGVLVNDLLYYPGDSFVIPGTAKVSALALPVSAPWLKFDMVAKFLKDVHPTLAFPTHDAILSSDGRQLTDRMVGAVASSQGILYKRLDGSSVDLGNGSN